VTIEVSERSADDDSQTISASISSEEAVERWGDEEILVHTDDAVDLTRAKSGLPLLFNHDGGKPIGIVENVRLSGRRLVGKLRFGKSAKAREVWEDVKDGVLKNLSVGYKIHRTQLGEGGEVLVVRWEPLEASVVAVPADHTIGIGRSKGSVMQTTTHENIENKDNSKSERTRASEILALGKRHNLIDLASRAIEDGTPLDRFRASVLDSIDEATPIDNGSTFIENGQNQLERYSIGNTVRAIVTGDWREAGLEREISREIQSKMGRAPEGVYVPSLALVQRSVLTSANSGSLIGTTHMGDLYIEALRNESMVLSLGATMLAGLQGNVSIPRNTVTSQAEWVAENAAAAESTPGHDNLTMSPKGLSARVSYSRKTLVQSNPNIEELMRSDLRQAVAVALDAAAINGSGTGNEPEGIMNTVGIGGVELGTNGGAPTWDMIVDLAKEVGVDNALMGNLAYLTNYAVTATLQRTPKQASGVEGNFILGEDISKLGSHGLGVSNNVPSNLTKGTGTDLSATIFGNWRDLMIGEWGALDLIIDPYTNADTGAVRIVAHSFYDIAVRRPQSFAVADDIITT